MKKGRSLRDMTTRSKKIVIIAYLFFISPLMRADLLFKFWNTSGRPIWGTLQKAQIKTVLQETGKKDIKEALPDYVAKNFELTGWQTVVQSEKSGAGESVRQEVSRKPNIVQIPGSGSNNWMRLTQLDKQDVYFFYFSYQAPEDSNNQGFFGVGFMPGKNILIELTQKGLTSATAKTAGVLFLKLPKVGKNDVIPLLGKKYGQTTAQLKTAIETKARIESNPYWFFIEKMSEFSKNDTDLSLPKSTRMIMQNTAQQEQFLKLYQEHCQQLDCIKFSITQARGHISYDQKIGKIIMNPYDLLGLSDAAVRSLAEGKQLTWQKYFQQLGEKFDTYFKNLPANSPEIKFEQSIKQIIRKIQGTVAPYRSLS